jgi:hypothetical protein
MVIAPPGRLPEVWRLKDASDVRERLGGDRKMDADWVDVPLSRVARDFSAGFGIDLVFHPHILDAQPLVQLEGRGLSLQKVLEAIEDQLKVAGRYDDGAIWMEPLALAASRPEGAASQPAAERSIGSGGWSAGSLVPIDWPAGDWAGFRRELGRAAGLTCEVHPPGRGVEQVPFAARGAWADVLEAGHLLGLWEWQVKGSAADRNAVLDVQLRPSLAAGRLNQEALEGPEKRP